MGIVLGSTKILVSYYLHKTITRTKNDIAQIEQQFQERQQIVDADLAVSLFQSKPPMWKYFHGEVPVQLQIVGTYHNFVRFAYMLSNIDELIILRDIEMLYDEGNSAMSMSCHVVIPIQKERFYVEF